MSTLEVRFPKLLEILGEKTFDEGWEDFIRFQEPWFIQLEQDLQYLSRFVGTNKLIECCFRKELWDARGEINKLREIAYEIYTEALLASVSEKIELHVPTHEGNKSKGPNFDFRVTIQGCEINGEVKTRRDEFPFNLRPKADPGDRIKINYGRRATNDIEPKGNWQTRESNVLKGILRKTLNQLPSFDKNIIILGAIRRKTLISLKDALRVIRKNEFAHINGVIWIHLDDSNLRRTSGIFFNPKAAEPFPKDVEDILIQLFDRQKYLGRELNHIREKIIRDCSPEKIILFGSLAQEKIHEWSDLDLAIIKKTDLPFIERSAEILRIIRPQVGINLFVYTPEEFCQLHQEGSFFIRDEIEKKGEIIYDRTDGLA